jgi:hypothetical protein
MPDNEYDTGEVDWEGVARQAMDDLEQARLRLLAKEPQETVLDRVDQVLIFMSRHDPMRIYIWTATICLILITAANLFSVAMEAKHGR